MKLKRQIFTLLFAIIICAAAAVPTSAVSDMPRLVDNAGLLSDSEQGELLGKLDEISERQQTDVVVLTTDSLDGKTPMDYADDFYDYNGYGFGEECDGVLLLVSMDDRDWWISTCGYGMTAITDDGIKYISERFLSYLSDGDYAEAFTTYAELCDEFISQAKYGQPYDGDNMPDGSYDYYGDGTAKLPFGTVKCLLISMAIGLIAALIVTGIMRAKLKSVRMQAAADSYVKADSMNITESRDMFLYSTVTRTERPKSDDSSGGSSSHTSSSGQSHGGGGGKF